MTSVIVHYGELALKGRNRPWFINTLVRSIRAALVATSTCATCGAFIGRIDVALGARRGLGRRCARGWRGCRASATSRAPTHVAPDLDAIADGRRWPASRAGRRRRFRIAARRADKRFPIPSPEIERDVGRRVQDAHRLAGRSLDTRTCTIHVEVLTDDAFFYFEQGARHGRLADRHERHA